jgi:hypothetical protein
VKFDFFLAHSTRCGFFDSSSYCNEMT